jgi:hypothetical protein
VLTFLNLPPYPTDLQVPQFSAIAEFFTVNFEHGRLKFDGAEFNIG